MRVQNMPHDRMRSSYKPVWSSQQGTSYTAIFKLAALEEFKDQIWKYFVFLTFGH